MNKAIFTVVLLGLLCLSAGCARRPADSGSSTPTAGDTITSADVTTTTSATPDESVSHNEDTPLAADSTTINRPTTPTPQKEDVAGDIFGEIETPTTSGKGSTTTTTTRSAAGADTTTKTNAGQPATTTTEREYTEWY